MPNSDFHTHLTNKHSELSQHGNAYQPSQHLVTARCWQHYYLCLYGSVHAVNNTGDSWTEKKESTMHGCWKRSHPELVQDFKGFEDTREE